MLAKNTESFQRFYLPGENSILRRPGVIFVDWFRAANFPAFGITLQADALRVGCAEQSFLIPETREKSRMRIIKPAGP